LTNRVDYRPAGRHRSTAAQSQRNFLFIGTRWVQPTARCFSDNVRAIRVYVIFAVR